MKRTSARLLTTIALGLASSAAATSAKAADGAVPQGWRLELLGAGELLPGGGKLRIGHGFGVGAGYSVLSLGAEYWRYQLTLHEGLSDTHEDAIVWVFYPLVFGLNIDIPSTPLRLGMSAGFGIGSAPEVMPGTCRTRRYTPTVERGRLQLHFVSTALSLGPYVGYAHSMQPSGTDEACGIGSNGPDPPRKDYPRTIPFGSELGFSVTVRVQ